MPCWYPQRSPATARAGSDLDLEHRDEDYSELWVGGTVGFGTTASGLAGYEDPMVAVWCYQELNDDGIHEWPNDAGDLVCMELRHPDEESWWDRLRVAWKGIGAGCKAVLYA